MILQSLTEYYDRKAGDPESRIARDGFEERAISYIIVISIFGEFINLEFSGDQSKNKRGRTFLVPMWQQKSGKDSWKKTNLLWDHYGYVLGHPKEDDAKSIDQAKKQHASFTKMIASALKILPNNIELLAIDRFYEKGGIERVKNHSLWAEAKRLIGCNFSFRIFNAMNLVPQSQEIQNISSSWNGVEFIQNERVEKAFGVCLVTGELQEISRLHRPISGVNAKPAPMLAVNNLESPSFASFNKEQGFNFPVSKGISFKYATALNNLLKHDSSQKLKIGDTTTVFWSDKQSHIEDNFKSYFDEPNKDDPDNLTEKVKALLNSVDSGVLPIEDSHTRFFILGLSPNSARISVRFWHSGTVAEFSHRIASHFHDLEIVHAPHLRDYLSIWWLLRSLAPQQKSENIPPNLAGDWMRTILNGLPYPETLFQSAIRRVHAEREVSYERAAIIKAFLNRKAKLESQPEKEMNVSLDKDNLNPGYRIGRLFAALEKIQEEASPGINSTIKDRYYSSASGTPASVFPILLRMKIHHAGKLPKERSIYFEKLLSDIMEEIESKGFPLQLSLADQGRFAIGYYHQRQNFFNK